MSGLRRRGVRKRTIKGTRTSTHLSQSPWYCQPARGDLNGVKHIPLLRPMFARLIVRIGVDNDSYKFRLVTPSTFSFCSNEFCDAKARLIFTCVRPCLYVRKEFNNIFMILKLIAIIIS